MAEKPIGQKSITERRLALESDEYTEGGSGSVKKEVGNETQVKDNIKRPEKP